MSNKIIDKPLNALKKYFGYDSFRTGQTDIIDAVMRGDDGLAVMTTGGGKSLCYQIPAVCKEGTAIVISPLIALMKDQVDTLQAKGVAATYINSSIDFSDKINRIGRLRDQQYKLIYMAPEGLKNEDVREALKQIDISFMAVDESHCISVWGNDFRPSYLKIADYLAEIEQARGERIQRFAYTATATPEIRQDILGNLKMNNPFVQVGKFDRPNIQFNVLQSRNKVSDLNDLLHVHKNDPKIIYTATIREGERLQRLLNERGMRVGFYHGRLDDPIKSRIQEDFVGGKLDTIIATNAFGMGVDKSDVRVVIHYHMPNNLENYFQEAGRAGRDGKMSKAYMLHSDSDIKIQGNFIDGSYPSPSIIEAVRNTVVGLIGDQPMNLSYDFIAHATTLPVGTTAIGPNTSRKLSTSEVTDLFSKLADMNVLTMRKNDANSIIYDAVQLDKNIVVQDETLGRDLEALRSLLSVLNTDINGTEVTTSFFVNRVNDAIDDTRVHIRGNQVESALRILETNGVIETKPVEGQQYTVGISVLDASKDIDLSYVSERKRIVSNNLAKIEAYANTKMCRRRAILRHFGEQHDHGKNCGGCDNCLKKTMSLNKTEAYGEEQIKGVLQLITETKGRLHSTRMAEILMGVKSKAIERREYDKLDSFGILKSFTKSEIATMFKALIEDEFVFFSKRDEQLKLTTKGMTAMGSHPKPVGFNEVPSSFTGFEKPKAKVVKAREIFDGELYEQICGTRRLIAEKHRKTVMMIFDDKVAKTIATVKPTTLEDLQRCGLTSNRTRIFGQEICDLITSYQLEKEKKASNQVDFAL
ncbi:RecQ family ATP-dependent DNA helicase [Vibrio harveyi]|uniref:RecQ family ATP-dependent DNA helicase n=1 Tax=Vibrio harveyi TaxID=669 RepID=UPI003CF72B85